MLKMHQSITRIRFMHFIPLELINVKLYKITSKIRIRILLWCILSIKRMYVSEPDLCLISATLIFSWDTHLFCQKRIIHTIKSLMHLNIWLFYFPKYGFLILTNFSLKQSTAEHEDLKVIVYTWITMRWWQFPGSFTLRHRRISYFDIDIP